MQHNGHDNGSETGSPVARFTEDETGATLDSGTAVCRFDTQLGGRLRRWQWRTVPPPDRRPTTDGRRRMLDLVDTRYGALIDHFLPLGSKPQEFAAGEQREFGDFAEGAFKRQVVDSGGEIRIGLLRDGAITAGKRVADVRMAKSAAVRPTADDLSALYRIINSSLRPIQILFAVEYNLFAPGVAEDPASLPECFYLIDGERPDDPSLSSFGVSPNATSLTLANPVGEMALQIGWDRECDLWRMPVPDDRRLTTDDRSNASASVRLLAVWRIQLPPRDNWAMGLWMAPG